MSNFISIFSLIILVIVLTVIMIVFKGKFKFNSEIEKPAWILRRVFMWSIDLIVVSLYVVLCFMGGFNFPILNWGWLLIPLFFYLPIIWNGQTIGGFALSAKVTNIDGSKVGFLKLTIRYISIIVLYGSGIIFSSITGIQQFSLISELLILLSIIFISYRKDRLSLHDMISQTYIQTTYKTNKK